MFLGMFGISHTAYHVPFIPLSFGNALWIDVGAEAILRSMSEVIDAANPLACDLIIS